MKSIFFYFLLVIAWVNKSPAQSLSPFVISSSGGSFNQNIGMLSFTTGEMSAVKTYSSTGKILTQGFQQTWDISTSTADHPHQRFSFTVYPNPTTRFFNLITETNVHEPITVIILDLLGREVWRRTYLQHADIQVESFELAGIPDGMYLIELKLNENKPYRRNSFFKKIQLIK